jgi:hypothetical protein
MPPIAHICRFNGRYSEISDVLMSLIVLVSAVLMADTNF